MPWYNFRAVSCEAPCTAAPFVFVMAPLQASGGGPAITCWRGARIVLSCRSSEESPACREGPALHNRWYYLLRRTAIGLRGNSTRIF